MQESREEKSHLEKIEENVYSRQEKPSYEKERLLEKNDTPDVSSIWLSQKREGWGGSKIEGTLRSPLMTKLLFGSVLFFILAAGLAFYNIFIGPRTISPDKIVLVMSGPPSTRGGDEMVMEVAVENRNSVGLLSSKLVLEYPEGVNVVGEEGGPTGRLVKDLGPIPAGDKVVEPLKLVVFGRENSEKRIVAKIEYRTPGSSGTFPTKEREYTVVVSSSPVSVTTKLPEEINAGEEFLFEVKLQANTTDSLKNILVILQYPPGFSLRGASPDPAFGTAAWRIVSLPPNKEEVIKIKGVINGEIDSKKTFTIKVGVESDDKPREISTLYTSLNETISIRKAFVGLTFNMPNARQGNNFTIYEGGDVVAVDVNWQNNLTTKIEDASFTVRVEGATVDRKSITANLGEYRSAEDVIVWNQRTDRTFTSLLPGQKGNIRFSFNTISLRDATGALYRKPEVVIKVTFNGTRISEGFINEPITVTANRAIRLASSVNLTTEGLFYTGPFANTGPLPPRAEQETTYTVTWKLTNSSNDIRTAVVSAKLPAYLKWLGKTSPGTEKVSFNEATGEVRWDVGDLPAGAGFSSVTKNMSFQVSFTPSLSQVGETPNLLSETRFTGFDTFIEGRTEAAQPTINTVQIKDLRPGESGEIRL